MFLGWGRRRCRTWLWLYLDKKNSFSSESSLSSSRVLKDRGRYPYRMAFFMTDCSRILSSACNNVILLVIMNDICVVDLCDAVLLLGCRCAGLLWSVSVCGFISATTGSSTVSYYSIIQHHLLSYFDV